MEKDFQKYSLEDYLDDTDFCGWARSERPDLDTFYNDLLEKFPEQKTNLNNARKLIELFEDEYLKTDTYRKQQLWEELNMRYHQEKRSVKSKVFFRVAASIAVLLAISSIIFYSVSTNTKTEYISALNIEDYNDTRLILNDGDEVNIQANKSEVIYTESGEEIKVNNKIIKKNEQNKKPQMNQLIVPYGKQSKIVLADGTTVWLNAGSSLSYPASFNGNLREVYLLGEAFFDVFSDSSKPFQVITKDLTIKVTGTTFNVTSYTNDNTTQTVLLSGKVSARENKRFSQSVELDPGERIVYNRIDDKLQKDKVNVELYSSWRNGYLIFDEETVQEVLKKLERYYDQKLTMEGPDISVKFSGKLNLDENLEEVLENISYSIPLALTKKQNEIIIKIKT